MAGVLKILGTYASNIRLEPSNYRSGPSIAWDAMLFMTNVELYLIKGLEMMEIMENEKRWFMLRRI